MKTIINSTRQDLSLNGYAILSSLFIMAFLGLFQPFEINNSSLRTILLSLPLIGFLHYSILVIFVSACKSLKPNHDLTKIQELYLILVFVLIAAVVTKFAHVLLGLSTFGLKSSVEWLYGSFLVMPIAHIVRLFIFDESIFDLTNRDKTNSKKSVTKEALENIELAKIYYIKAMENYVNVIWYNKDKVEKTMIRSTLTNLERLLDKKQFFRCHRSFIINTYKSFEIPVSYTHLTLPTKRIV